MAYGEGSTNNLEKRETISSAIAGFENHTARLSKLAHQLDAIGDRLEGSKPSAVGEGQADPPPAHMADDLRRRHRAFNKLIGECEEATTRIANALGM